MDAVQSRKEAGCIRFDVLQDPVDKTKWVFFEAYVNAAAVDFHKEQQHFKDFFVFVGTGAVEIESVA